MAGRLHPSVRSAGRLACGEFHFTTATFFARLKSGLEMGAGGSYACIYSLTPINHASRRGGEWVRDIERARIATKISPSCENKRAAPTKERL